MIGKSSDGEEFLRAWLVGFFVFNGIKVKEDIDNIAKLKGKHFYYFISLMISLICECHVIDLFLAPYIYFDTVRSQLVKKKGVPKNAMIFMTPSIDRVKTLTNHTDLSLKTGWKQMRMASPSISFWQF
jgi:hypothetical protein